MADSKVAVQPGAEAPATTRERLKQVILARFPVRAHLSLILAGCFASGLLATTLLHWAGVNSMLIRYPLALLVAYGAFLVGIRMWLYYAGYGRALESHTGNAARDRAGDGLDWFNGVGGSWGSSGSSGGGSSALGGGGGAGGGGASASFDAPTGTQSSLGLFSSVGGSSSSGGSGGDLDIDGGDGFMVLVALLALLATVFAAAIYLIYAAPTILADAAFAAMLSAGLIRSTKRIGDSGWMGSVVSDTWMAFAGVLVLTVIFAAVAAHYYPDAHTLREVWRKF